MIRTLDLGGQWSLQQIDGKYGLNAKVPGSVLNDLYNDGQIPDLFYQDNEGIATELSYHDYVYTREFVLDDDHLAEDHAELKFEGIDTLAEVKVNGVDVFKTANMHRSFSADIKNVLHSGINTIEVLISSPSKYVDQRQTDGNIKFYIDSIKYGCQYIRKAQCMFGWDWGPKMPDAGIWRPVYMNFFSHARLGDIRFIQNHRNDSVELTTEIKINGVPDTRQMVRLSIVGNDGAEYSEVKSINGQEAVFITLIDQPQLWWANGYGEPSLYTAQVCLLDKDQIIDSRQMRIGLRVLEVSREADQWGNEFCFMLNGLKIFAKGANYIPEDSIISRRSPKQTRKLLSACKEANFNSVRVWGGGIYPDDWFYDACDELGLIVWQDFMFACNIYEFDDDFTANVMAEATEIVQHLRHHACIGLWCGNNEMEVGWHEWGGVASSSQAHQEQYRKFFENDLKDILHREDPQRFYWPSSPSSGGGDAAPSDENTGDNHYWQVWHGLKPFSDYRRHHFRFLSEFGFQSFPSRKTVNTFAEKEDMNIFSYIMEQHQKNNAANGKILYYLSENYLYPKNFNMVIYASQLLQAEAMKYCIEHMRRSRGQCMGSYYWQLNDCWPVASWSSIDYFGRWKALHYFARKFYAQILLSAEDKGYKVRFHIANENCSSAEGYINWQLRDNRSRIMDSGTYQFNVPALSGEYLDEIDFGSRLLTIQEQHNRYLSYEMVIGGVKISEASLLFCKAKHFEFVDPGIEMRISENKSGYEIILKSEAYAQNVYLDLVAADCIFSDNWFSLNAGETRHILVDKDRIFPDLTPEEFSNQISLVSVYDIPDR